jgi:nitroreductase/NAD-dependent dihydropyrimidine dehydrogenase PreA subunit
MNWVTIEKEKCDNCGICVIRCNSCFTDSDSGITANANEETCNLCGHCISLCHTEAIVHEKMDIGNFPEADNEIKYDPDEFIRFIRRRRSHRHFKNKKIPRADLEKLVDLCRYAPTGSNAQAVEIKVIQSQDKIKKLSDLTLDYFIDLMKQVDDQVEVLRSEEKEVPKDLQMIQAKLARYKSMAIAKNHGLDVIFYNAPALMVFHSSQMATTPKDDCMIAAHTVALTAMTMGLETCYIGLFNAAAKNYPPAQKELKLPDENTIYSVLILGYPKLKYRLTVDRKQIKVEWE